ncbi:DUF1919 domain-containing protein [Saccharicrinis sp. GN24d3]|uniref:DUF1919 domain-containing protein n=1 Tax=Saccharicrinis sp. GN24d3 TaxID=3458416 RepID=UPI004036988E
MRFSLKLKYRAINNSIYSFLQRIRLKNRNFVIISNNCWGGDVYGILQKEYNTPFVGLFLFAPCYMKMLHDFPNSLEKPLLFKKSSKYIKNEIDYPVGVLNDDIEIHFLHYTNEQEAIEKWNRRCKRLLNSINSTDVELFFKMDDRDACSKEIINNFHQLPLKNKVSFSEYSQKNNILYNSHTNLVILSGTTKVFDAINWINKGTIKNTTINKIISKLWPLKKMWE